MNYADFITSKQLRHCGDGIPYSSRNDALYPFQRDLVERSLRLGRSAIFAARFMVT